MLQHKLDKAFDVYGDTIQSIADVEWSERGKPFLDKNCIAFSQVNGDWWISRNGEDYFAHDFHPNVIAYKYEDGGFPEVFQGTEWQQVFGVLEALVPGQRMISLGNYMPSYTPR